LVPLTVIKDKYSLTSPKGAETWKLEALKCKLEVAPEDGAPFNVTYKLELIKELVSAKRQLVHVKFTRIVQHSTAEKKYAGEPEFFKNDTSGSSISTGSGIGTSSCMKDALEELKTNEGGSLTGSILTATLAEEDELDASLRAKEIPKMP